MLKHTDSVDLSVIIPTYNRSVLLPGLIEAWRKVDQVTRYRYEIIFSDDGSQDNTVKILQSVDDLPVTVIENKHGGPSTARNSAIKHAQGSRLLIIGDDIFPNSEMINQHCDLASQLGNTVAILGGVVWHDALEINHLMVHITEVGNEQFSFNRLAPHKFTDFRHFYSCNISIDRELLLSERVLFAESFYKCNFEDVELGYRLSKKGLKIYYAPEVFGYHYHPYTVDGFCKRQENAGEMAVVLQELHPEIGSILGFRDIAKRFDKFLSVHARREMTIDEKCSIAKIVARCEMYEALLHNRELDSYERKLIKNNLSNIYLRLFKLCYELGFLKKFTSKKEDIIFSFLFEVYFGWDSYWDTYYSFDEMCNRYSQKDKNYLLNLAEQHRLASRAELHSMLIQTNLNLLHLHEQIGRGKLKDMLFHKLVYAKLAVKSFLKRFRFAHTIKSRVIRLRQRAQHLTEGSKGGGGIRIGFIVKNPASLPEDYQNQLRSSFGERVCVIVPNGDSFLVISSGAGKTIFSGLSSIPVDYIYAPQDVEKVLSLEHLKNVVLCLQCFRYDFLLVSYSLSKLPFVGMTSLTNQLVYSKNLGEVLLRGGTLPAIGRVLRLQPPIGDYQDVSLEEVFDNHRVTCEPEEAIVHIGQKKPLLINRDVESCCIEFKRTKKVIFVWPIFMAVGGVERNTIEIMRQLKDTYHFVLITMEKLSRAQGSLHHQLKGITSDIYDMAELASQSDFLTMLRVLKRVYAPDLVWICNGSPWLADNAMNIRELFQEIPIVDQQVYDVKHGWINRYAEKGIQSFDRFIAINRKIEQLFIAAIGIPKDRVDLIYHAVDTDRVLAVPSDPDSLSLLRSKYQVEANQRLFVFIGRFHPQKRPLDFLAFAHKRQERGDGSLFIMVGNGELDRDVQDFITRNGLKNTRTIGFLENPLELLALSSGIIFTSEYEGLPIAMLEAMCMGVPVFSSDVGDIGEIVHAYGAGMAFPFTGNAEEYDAIFEKFLERLPHFQESLRETSPLVRERFSGRNVSKQYADTFERAMTVFRYGRQTVLRTR